MKTATEAATKTATEAATVAAAKTATEAAAVATRAATKAPVVITFARMMTTGSLTMIPNKGQSFSAAAKGAFLKPTAGGLVPHFRATLYDENGNPVVIEGCCRPSEAGNVTASFVIHGLKCEVYWAPGKEKGSKAKPVNGDEALNRLL